MRGNVNPDSLQILESFKAKFFLVKRIVILSACSPDWKRTLNVADM